MTDNKKYNDKEYIDKNVDSLLELGKPVPKMPEDLKDRIRSRLIQMEPESDKMKIFSLRWSILPLAAAAALIFFIIFPWMGNLSGSITWADVQKQLDQLHSISFRVCVDTEFPEGKKLSYCSNIFQKDPFYKREEWEILKSDITGMEPGSNVTYLAKLAPGRLDTLMLYDKSRKAQVENWLWNANSRREPPFQSILNKVSKSWEIIKKVSEDETKIIGERVINGIPAVGFSFKNLPPKKIHFPDNTTVVQDTLFSYELWVNRNDGTPIMAKGEFEVKILPGDIRRSCAEYKDFHLNVPLDDKLFNMDVPEGWQIIKTQHMTIDYDGNKLAPDVTLKINTMDQKCKITDKDIAGIVQAVETSYSGSNKNDVKVTIELSPKAAENLYKNAKSSMDGIVGDFNNQLRIVAKLNEDDPNLLTFDLSGLNLSLCEIEKRYFTETSHINEEVDLNM